MTENLAEHLVRHRYVCFAPHMITELRLDHAKGALDIRSLMIVPQEFLAVEGEVMKHLLPQATGCPAVDTLERNIRGGPMAGNDLMVIDARVALIG